MHSYALLLPVLLLAATLQGAMVKSVEVLGTKRPLILETRAGQPYDSAAATRDVRKLWASGWFEDVRVESADTPEGADVTFHVVERQRLTLGKTVLPKHFGNRPLGLAAGDPIDTQRAQELARTLTRQFVEDGYPDAKVSVSLVPSGMKTADLVLELEEGPKYKVDGVRFTGEPGFEPDELKKALQATRSRPLLFWRLLPAYSDAATQSDLSRLLSFYLAHGYFDARVRIDSVERAKGKAAVTYWAQAGKQYVVDSAAVRANATGVSLSLPTKGEFPAKELCQCLLDARKQTEKEGRLDFDARVRIQDEGAPGHVTLLANYQAGEPYTVGRIEFHGNHSISDITLRKAMLLDEGRVFDFERLPRSLARINAMNTFEPLNGLNVRLSRDEARHVADVSIYLKEKKRGRWAISGPVGPFSVGGPLQGLIATRLPPWGRGILEASTYYLTFSLSAFTTPALLGGLLPKSTGLLPIISLSRPLLPGQRWTSGFTLSPQLGWSTMGLSYGMAQAHQLVRSALKADYPRPEALMVTVERTGQEGPAGYLSCEPRGPRLRWLRTAAIIGSDFLLGARIF